mmetsp:Transcript_34135/g.55643  ORF Transcript_34135/g.55643 Transcript_34135/m.55643 type:complete len:449 (-) Transcript_34135:1299-2645(-)
MDEVLNLVEDFKDEQKNSLFLRKIVGFLAIFFVVMCAMQFVIVYWVAEITKEIKADDEQHVLRPKDGDAIYVAEPLFTVAYSVQTQTETNRRRLAGEELGLLDLLFEYQNKSNIMPRSQMQKLTALYKAGTNAIVTLEPPTLTGSAADGPPSQSTGDDQKFRLNECELYPRPSASMTAECEVRSEMDDVFVSHYDDEDYASTLNYTQSAFDEMSDELDETVNYCELLCERENGTLNESDVNMEEMRHSFDSMANSGQQLVVKCFFYSDDCEYKIREQDLSTAHNLVVPNVVNKLMVFERQVEREWIYQDMLEHDMYYNGYFIDDSDFSTAPNFTLSDDTAVDELFNATAFDYYADWETPNPNSTRRRLMGERRRLLADSRRRILEFHNNSLASINAKIANTQHGVDLIPTLLSEWQRHTTRHFDSVEASMFPVRRRRRLASSSSESPA